MALGQPLDTGGLALLLRRACTRRQAQCGLWLGTTCRVMDVNSAGGCAPYACSGVVAIHIISFGGLRLLVAAIVFMPRLIHPTALCSALETHGQRGRGCG